MPTLVALKPHRYNGKIWRKGQTFDASADDALVLRALKVAGDPPINMTPVAPDEPQPVKRPRGRPRKSTYETRAMVADRVPVETVSVTTFEDDPREDESPSED
jgi:hypothetical protein